MTSQPEIYVKRSEFYGTLGSLLMLIGGGFSSLGSIFLKIFGFGVVILGVFAVFLAIDRRKIEQGK